MEQQIIDLAVAHKWLALAAVIIGLFVRLLKSDNAFPLTIPDAWKKWKPAVAIGLGLLAGVLDKIATGTPWRDAMIAGLITGLIPVIGHQVGIEWLRDGKEIPVSLPPSGPAAMVLVAFLGLSAGGCSGTFEEMRLLGIKSRPVAASASASPMRDDARCRDIANSQRWWKATATAGLAVTGASGVALIPVPPEFRAVPIGICVGAGVTAAFAKVMADGLADEWAKDCSS